ncbi:hypothetical protein B296_00038606 [Ensete ventricosum]|uniref:Uncharacterized protein n=1 Tax=Ensete ventricosum TaxID=4639 RepID=A0A426XAZ8_ENSVE|nr:hypothetical protein B296_00038606 [Ensete ventricosum]
MLRAASDSLCPRPGVVALKRQPLRAGGAASCGHLVCKPIHDRCAHRRPPLRVGVALQAVAPTGVAQGREENRRGRPKLQPINHESPLLFIESH